MDQEEFARIVAKETRLVKKLKTLACLPEASWIQEAESLLKSCPELGVPASAARRSIEFFRGDMLVQQTRLGRAVQPIGELDILAPIIGAIRLKSPGANHALNFLVNQIIPAIENSGGDILRLIAKFSDEPLRAHRNCVLWDAIFELMEENSRIIYTSENGPKIRSMSIPNTKAVREYVIKQQIHRRRFLNLPQDDKGWTRLWKDSKAERIIQKASRGKGTH